MTAPKHLWSGDWERESKDLPASTPVPMAPAPPEEPEPTPSLLPTRRTLVFSSLAAVVVVAAGLLVVGLTRGSSPTRATAQVQTVPVNPSGGGGLVPQPQTTPQQSVTPTTSAPAAVQDGPTYTWLGMQISDTPNGVTVATVTIGGAGDTDGVDPGDVIQSINSTQINSIAQLRSATGGLSIGKSFQLTVDRGTTALTLTATLTNRPTHQ